MSDTPSFLHQENLNALLHLAHQAGDAIMAVYNDIAGIAVEQKTDNSPVTLADIAAHDVIAAALPEILDVPMISEESPLPLFAERLHWQHYWLVDPLDGTREFIRRSGEFTVNIALIAQGVPVLGLVYLPVQRVAYLGVAPQISADFAGAWKYCGDSPAVPIHVRPLQNQPGETLTVLASHRHGTAAVNDLMGQVSKQWRGDIELTQLGSSLKFCRIAEGKADLYPRLAPTSEWDTAAAQAVLVAAGGSVIRAPLSCRKGMEALDYNQADSILNPNFYALGDRDFNWASLLGG